jgi:hypothetical protein
MGPEEIPNWVPPLVKKIALADYLQRRPSDQAIIRRLATSPEMRIVWKTLQAQAMPNCTELYFGPAPRLDPEIMERIALIQTRADFDSLMADLFEAQDAACNYPSPKEAAAASFFCYAVQALAISPIVSLRADHERAAANWHTAAERCRWALRREGRVQVDIKFREALSIVGEYFEQKGKERELINNPFVVGKKRASDNIRVRVRALATRTQRLFGTFLYGTLATVATVGLGPPEIEEQSVRNWCSDLRPPVHKKPRLMTDRQ